MSGVAAGLTGFAVLLALMDITERKRAEARLGGRAGKPLTFNLSRISLY